MCCSHEDNIECKEVHLKPQPVLLADSGKTQEVNDIEVIGEEEAGWKEQRNWTNSAILISGAVIATAKDSSQLLLRIHVGGDLPEGIAITSLAEVNKLHATSIVAILVKDIVRSTVAINKGYDNIGSIGVSDSSVLPKVNRSSKDEAIHLRE
jgi:hypothetical protein